MNVGLLSVAEIILLSFASADTPVPKNRCPKENPYPFRNQTFCCSRPVYFEWNKDGQCYGRSQKCPYDEGCVNCRYHSKLHTLNSRILNPKYIWNFKLCMILKGLRDLFWLQF